MWPVKRGEVWWVAFDPSVGGEIQKTRPAVIVSNDAGNRSLNRVQVIPFTSNVKKCYPFEALVTLKGRQSKVMADQLTTVSKLRVKGYIDALSAEDMTMVNAILRLQLDLSHHA